MASPKDHPDIIAITCLEWKHILVNNIWTWQKRFTIYETVILNEDVQWVLRGMKDPVEVLVALSCADLRDAFCSPVLGATFCTTNQCGNYSRSITGPRARGFLGERAAFYI